MLWSGRQKGCVLREISSCGIVSAVKIYQTWVPVEKIMRCFWWGGVLDRCEEGVSKGALQSGINNVEFIVCTKERWAGSTATFYFDFYVLLHLLKKTWRSEERPDFVNGTDEQGRMHTEGDRGTLSWLMTNYEKWKINDPSKWNIDVTRDCLCTCGCSATWPVKFWQECLKN